MNIYEIRNVIFLWFFCIFWILWNLLVFFRLLNIYEISLVYYIFFIYEIILLMLFFGYYRKIFYFLFFLIVGISISIIDL